jgi:hypothetical protein
MISVEPWTVQAFQSQSISGTLDVSPEFQRRGVWNQKAKMLLADSVVRGVPIGAITLYADDSSGYDQYEVIDGKQRLTALLDFLGNGFQIKTSTILSGALDDDEFNLDNDAVTSDCHNKSFSDFPQPRKMAMLQYKIPVFVVRGPRSNAIRSFTRMNQSSYALKPQEIRNAFFHDSAYLAAAVGIAEELESTLVEGSPPFLVGLGVMSKDAHQRMQDIQLLSELLLLTLEGPQHRRDRLDEAYELYRSVSGASSRRLSEASNKVTSIVRQIDRISKGLPLQAYHFPSSCEHDFYGLFGALEEHGLLSDAQILSVGDELITVISGFRRQVVQFVARVRDGGDTASEEFGELVEQYGRGFLGGQINGRERRRERIKIWRAVIDDVVASLDSSSSFSDIQRRLIWARSEEKLCARCLQPVEWAEYHAGHKIAHALGGKTEVENGQVEHAACNISAGAT